MSSFAEQSVVIVGAGVIGLSTAYYISTSSNPPRVYVLDNSPILFQCASGRAAGFITKDWFNSSLAALGELSFRLHRELADKFDGRRNWGYSETIALSLKEPDGDELGGAKKERRGEDWLFDGGSRRVMAGGISSLESDYQWPQWLKKADGYMLSTVDSTAQVDPRRFCEFLLNQCKEHGVTVLNPVTATSVIIDVKTGLPATLSYTTQGFSEHTIPCTSLLLAAGPWTGLVYKTLFPKSEVEVPISNLAGWSVVFRDLAPVLASTTPCHSAFTTSRDENFCPEVFSRIQPVTSEEDYDSCREIYLAGLNSSEIPLPNIATEVETPELYDPHIASLLRAARRIFTPSSPVNKSGENVTNENGSLEVLRTSLCHRPVTPSGRPILTRLDPWHYAPHLVLLSGNATSDVRMKGGHQGGLYVCAGHGPWGIALSLGSGKVCADLIMGYTETPIYSSQFVA